MLGDLAIALALRDVPQHLHLARGELGAIGRILGHGDKLVEQFGGHAGRDE
ncbi:hypothetical protein D3C83_201570 [compost metagenome]